MNYSCTRRLQAWAFFISLAMSVSIARADRYGAAAYWDPSYGSYFDTQLGEGNPSAVATVGQTFTVPSNDGPFLNNFSVWMYNLTADPVAYSGLVMQWNGQQAVGPVLYNSGEMTMPSAPTFVSFTPDVELIPGLQYVFILSTSQYLDGMDRRATISGIIPPNTDMYGGGGFVYLDNGADTSQWTTDDWGVDTADTGFWVTFSAFEHIPEPPLSVPDPANASLLAISAAFLAFEGLRRKYARKALKLV